MLGASIACGGCFALARTDARVHPGWSGQVALQGNFVKIVGDGPDPGHGGVIPIPEVDVGYGWTRAALTLKAPIAWINEEGPTAVLDAYAQVPSLGPLAHGLGVELGTRPGAYYAATVPFGAAAFATLTNRLVVWAPFAQSQRFFWNPQLTVGYGRVFVLAAWFASSHGANDDFFCAGVGVTID